MLHKQQANTTPSEVRESDERYRVQLHNSLCSYLVRAIRRVSEGRR